MPPYDIRRILAESEFWPNDLSTALREKCDAGDHLQHLSAAERAYYLAHEVLVETFASGLEGYYWCAAGDHHREAASALRTVGLERDADLLEETFAAWPGGDPPSSVADREDTLWAWMDGNPTPHPLEDIYGRWCSGGPDRYEVLRQFVESHVDDFEGGGNPGRPTSRSG